MVIDMIPKVEFKPKFRIHLIYSAKESIVAESLQAASQILL